MKVVSLEDSRKVPSDLVMVEKPNQNICLLCGGSGWVYTSANVGEEDFGKAIPCECRLEVLKQEREAKLIRLCELPIGSESLCFAKFECSNVKVLLKALNSAKDIVAGRLLWLVLQGDVARGKTHLAVAICREWLRQGKVAKYIFVPMMLDWLRQGYQEDKIAEIQGCLPNMGFDQRLKFIIEVPLLVLDDLGVQKPSVWANEKIMTIIDYRYINNLPLVVTTNKSLENLPGDDEHRVASRLMRFERGRLILLDAPEYKKGEQRGGLPVK